MTHGVLDDGRGVARQKLFRHKHEVETGRTSSVGNVGFFVKSQFYLNIIFKSKDILGFDTQGAIVNRPDTHGSQALDWTDICQKAAKVNDLLLLLTKTNFYY